MYNRAISRLFDSPNKPFCFATLPQMCTSNIERVIYLIVLQGPFYPVLAFRRILQDGAVLHWVEAGSYLLASYMLSLNPSFPAGVPSMAHHSVISNMCTNITTTYLIEDISSFQSSIRLKYDNVK